MSLNKGRKTHYVRRVASTFRSINFIGSNDCRKAECHYRNCVEKVLAMTAPLGIFSHQLQRFIHLVWDVRDVINDNIKGNGQTRTIYVFKR